MGLDYTRTIVLSVALAAAATGQATAADLPARRGGLWELTTTMTDGSEKRDQQLKICIDDEMERTTVASSMAEHKAQCSTYKIEADGGKTTVEAECVFNKTNVNSHTVMSGDFKSAFAVRIESTTWRGGESPSGTKAPASRVVKRTIEQTGTYVGPACGDLKPGEAVGPDGQKVLVQ